MKTKDKIVRVDGKRWDLPEVLQFKRSETLWPDNMYYYEAKEFRPPKKGEYYISGAFPEAYRAPNDLSNAFLIAVPTHKASRQQVWLRGEAVS